MLLYIHLPFCKSKCQYCDFNSYACLGDEVIFSYLFALNKEIRYAGAKFSKAKIDTIYIGGGTPSLLDSKQIISIANCIKSSFDLSDLKEFSIECNPESIDREKLVAYKSVGINRISIGVQSLDDNNLRSMGRLHNSKTALEKINLAREYFDNVSCDLIIGLPYDTIESVRSEVSTLAPLVDHISMYELSVESGTPLAQRVKDESIWLPDDDETVELFNVAFDTAEEFGLIRYEVSNFSKGDKLSLHNFGYWTREEYIGIGAGAHSLIKTSDGVTPLANEIRFASPKNVYAYIGGINCVDTFDDVPRVDMDVLNASDVTNEEIMLALRTTKGIKASAIEHKLAPDIEKFFVKNGENLALTREGMSVMNSILVKILN